MPVLRLPGYLIASSVSSRVYSIAAWGKPKTGTISLEPIENIFFGREDKHPQLCHGLVLQISLFSRISSFLAASHLGAEFSIICSFFPPSFKNRFKRIKIQENCVSLLGTSNKILNNLSRKRIYKYLYIYTNFNKFLPLRVTNNWQTSYDSSGFCSTAFFYSSFYHRQSSLLSNQWIHPLIFVYL